MFAKPVRSGAMPREDPRSTVNFDRIDLKESGLDHDLGERPK